MKKMTPNSLSFLLSLFHEEKGDMDNKSKKRGESGLGDRGGWTLLCLYCCVRVSSEERHHAAQQFAARHLLLNCDNVVAGCHRAVHL